jgi:hypothetical protein
VILDTRLTLLPYIGQVREIREKAAQKLGVLGPFSIKDWGPAVQVAHSSFDEQRVPHVEDCWTHPR